jgi:7-cyano-7-deazaguanine synthase
MSTPPTAVALLSGGLDSATAAALAQEAGQRVIGLSFDYGQRHRRELEAAEAVAAALGLAEHHTIAVNLASWGGSALTDSRIALPTGGVVEGTIPATYVPGRNTVFIAIGLSLAEARGAERLVLGVNAVDYSGYPDCRPDYLEAFQTLADLASRAGREGRGPQLWAPLVEWSKTRIVREALRLGVPIATTWSCYGGGSLPCGLCDSCRIRDGALVEAGRADLTSAALANGSCADPEAVDPEAVAPEAVDPEAVDLKAVDPEAVATQRAAEP